MDNKAYRSCTDELSKIALKVQAPGVKMFKTKLKAHVVSPQKVVGKMKPATPKGPPGLSSPDFFVSHAGDAARSMNPPPVRM